MAVASMVVCGPLLGYHPGLPIEVQGGKRCQFTAQTEREKEREKAGSVQGTNIYHLTPGLLAEGFITNHRDND